MIQPKLSDDAFLASVDAIPAHDPDLHLWWLGQSGFLLQWQGHRCLLDPYLSDSLTRKYAGTDKPHVRMTGRVIDPARLSRIDAVTSSHNHTDHLDPDTLQPLLQANPAILILVPRANRTFAAERLGLPKARLTTINAGELLQTGPLNFTAVPAAHESLETDEHGCHRFLGYVVSAGPWKIYHSGDTILFPGLESLLQPLGIHIALLPINGRAPERRVAGNLTGREAAALAHAIGAPHTIPCHFNMFAFNTASPDDFTAECRHRSVPHSVLEAGQHWSTACLRTPPAGH